MRNDFTAFERLASQDARFCLSPTDDARRAFVPAAVDGVFPVIPESLCINHIARDVLPVLSGAVGSSPGPVGVDLRMEDGLGWVQEPCSGKWILWRTASE